MKILGLILTVCYAALMLYAVIKDRQKGLPPVLIGVGALLLLAYAFFWGALNDNWIPVLVCGILAISGGTLLNGLRQEKLHVSHHVLRLIIGVALIVVCWIG